VAVRRGLRGKTLDARPNVDWEVAGRMARAAYHADRSALDGNDFEAGYLAAVKEFSTRIGSADDWQVDDPLFTTVDVQVDKGFYRLMHASKGKRSR
jgi:hypothetical protein